MAVLIKNDQQLYKGRGPLDSKTLVKTYAELLDTSTWTKEDTLIAYNGMIVAVWLNKNDTSKNGIYFLFDPNVTTAIKKPDVANESNWHKFANLSDIEALSNKVDVCSAAIAAEQSRAEVAEAALGAKIDEVLQAAKDYADANDTDTVYDDSEISARISAIESDYLKESDKFDDSELKSQIASLQEAISNLASFKAEVVNSIDEVTETGILYLVKDETVAGADKYNEYIVIDDVATLIGDTTIDLSGYYTKTEIDSKLESIDADLSAEVSAREELASEVAELKEIDNATQAELDAYKQEVSTAIEAAKQEAINDADNKLAAKVPTAVFEEFQADIAASISTAKQEAIDAAATDAAKVYAIATEVSTTYATKAELNTHKDEAIAALESYAKKADVEAELARKIDAGSITHTTETLPEGITVDGTSLKIVIDAFTKAETRDYVAEVISQMTGGESAADVLLALNNYKESNNERVGAIETKNSEQDDKIAELLTAAQENAAKLAGVSSTVVDYVAEQLESILMPKASAEITIEEDGTLGIGEVSTDKLAQGEKTLVISGGDAID